MKIDKEYLIENKRKIMAVLSVLLISISLFTIGWVIYRFFFWTPPVAVDPFAVNFSMFNLTK